MRAFIFCFSFLLSLGFGFNSIAQKIPQLGIVESIERDSLVYASGFNLIGETVGKMLAPTLTEEQFQENLKTIKKAKTKLYLCNVLFPGSLKIAGPEVDEQKVLNYVDQVFARAKIANVPVIVLGSGGSRRLPDGYDNETAKADFIKLCKEMALLAKKYNLLIAIESLNSTETNFLNTVQEAAEIVSKVNHPNFKLNADIYHMLKENEPPQHIIDAGKLIAHVEIAEKEKRTLPGVVGEDFRPYFRALKQIKYKGPIVIEAKGNNPSQEIPVAHQYLTKQLREVYSEKK
ncbi:sugar phosphate isomerase/epimerase family protein [Adhaeribacter radiodurans]|uniref:Sugar phosphate isomerase/epimerase n=1 Tax=Adhaeribacter radiodurans TaxID=2745197 RepID=A0A7L7L4L2_9BACT|nr:sugar phosphate isomerase/epimerase family protein [Adhaeribacter radiodurans]QMU27748.1 sugar phosphate isomerase/epimerase [Adhaeribacter radiodurans]